MDFQSMTLPDDLGKWLVKIHQLLSGTIAELSDGTAIYSPTGPCGVDIVERFVRMTRIRRRPNLIFQIQDITDKKFAEEKLQHEATHDVLTGLPNRS